MAMDTGRCALCIIRKEAEFLRTGKKLLAPTGIKTRFFGCVRKMK